MHTVDVEDDDDDEDVDWDRDFEHLRWRDSTKCDELDEDDEERRRFVAAVRLSFLECFPFLRSGFDR